MGAMKPWSACGCANNVDEVEVGADDMNVGARNGCEDKDE